ncbi:ABC transporter substrate-binding protein [Planococcus shenhongbingii]|uniref:ABC transporter substrate-binding protein n=1 Tax=Planococcus shenhongbingii TaxID=3058398 RepID=UPI002618B0F6|nr:ABC transporter substrate-binding protein [Planococcus sp. N016]WKA59868.1 ABC transporter substrate-binding protein [Planococcus sp. N016]
MEKNLLALWQAVPSGEIKKEKIVEVLDLSAKQATRYIRKWAAEGWFNYISGRGRGNSSELQWLKNVEEIYEKQLMEIIEQEAVETSSKYLMYDWSIDSKTRLINKFRSKFGFFQHTSDVDKLIIPRKYAVTTMHPLEAADIQSANVVATIFNRLVAVDAAGKVLPELAHSWDVSATRLRMYLKKDVKFHDDSFLTAEDVAECLNRLRTHVHYKELWEPVEKIQAVGPLVIDFDFPSGCSYCLQMLGLMNSSIYKESQGQLIGTGSFYADNSHDFKTVLHAFKDFFGERPLLDRVEFVQVPSDFDFVYRSATQPDTEKTFMVESDSGVGVVIMNAFRNSDIRRKEVRDYLHWIIAKYRHEIVQYNPRALPNHQSMLIGQNQHYQVEEVKRPIFTKPLIIKTTDYLEKATAWIQAAFEKEGIPIEIQHLPFEEMLFDNGIDQQADLFIRGEVFEMNQNFSFYHFLKNGNSPLVKMINTDENLSHLLEKYVHSPFEEWLSLNLKVEKALMDSSILIPLYYEKRQIPFSADLMNINISHFGYVDFSKLWVRPTIAG